MPSRLARVRHVLGDAQRRRQALHLRQELKATLQHRIHAALSREVQVRVQVALALPDADVETVWLEMSEHEKVLYQLHACADGIPKWADENRMTELTIADLGNGLSKRRNALAGMYSKDAVVGTTDQYLPTLSRPAPGALRVNGALTSLNLSGGYGCDNIGPEGAKAIAEALKVNGALTSLDLRYNNLGGAAEGLLRDAVNTKSGFEWQM